jgi:hypothetical protein
MLVLVGDEAGHAEILLCGRIHKTEERRCQQLLPKDSTVRLLFVFATRGAEMGTGRETKMMDFIEAMPRIAEYEPIALFRR